MGDKRQKNQLELAFAWVGRGEAPSDQRKGTESSMARYESERLAENEQLMEKVCEPRNLKQALRRVKANGGSPGIDGMRVEELAGWLIGNWNALRGELLNGRYKPSAVKRVEIAKPEGGVRKLGVPTVIDRFVQQAVHQVLHEPVDHRRHSEFPHSAFRLRDLHPFYRTRFVPPVQQLSSQRIPVPDQPPRQLLDSHPVDSRAAAVGFHSPQRLFQIPRLTYLLHQLLVLGQAFGFVSRH